MRARFARSFLLHLLETSTWNISSCIWQFLGFWFTKVVCFKRYRYFCCTSRSFCVYDSDRSSGTWVIAGGGVPCTFLLVLGMLASSIWRALNATWQYQYLLASDNVQLPVRVAWSVELSKEVRYRRWWCSTQSFCVHGSEHWVPQDCIAGGRNYVLLCCEPL